MKKFLLALTALVATLAANAEPETYDIEGSAITIAEYESESQEWYISFTDANAEWKIALGLNCTDSTLAGNHTITDAIDGECYASRKDEWDDEEQYFFTNMNITITMPVGITDPKTGCEITGTANDADGNTFNFHMKKDPPIQPKSIVNIPVNVTVAEWPSKLNSSGAYYELTEQNDATKKWILSLNWLQGESNVDNIDTTVSGRFNALTDDRLLTIDNATVNQTFNPQSLSVQVEAQLVMTDSIQYNLIFVNQLSVKREDTLVYTDLHIDRTYSEYGQTTLSASNDSTELQIDIWDYAQIPDEYTNENTDIYVTLYRDQQSYLFSKHALSYARTELFGTDSVVLHTRFLADDSVAYTITAYYQLPQITDTISIIKTTDNATIGDNTSSGDGVYFDAQEDDGELYHVWIRILSESIDGHFTEANLDDNSMITIADTLRGMNRRFYINQADLTVTHNGIVYTIAGTCRAAEHFINLSISANYQGITNDNYEEDIDITFTSSDAVTIEHDSWNNSIGVKLHNELRNDQLYLMLYPENYDSSIIPAGDYTIGGWDGSYAYAGNFDEWEDTAVPSYYGTLDDNGNLNKPMWFLTAGTITVKENGSIEVQATNSYKRTVHIVFTNATTAIEENAVNTKAMKFIKNGHLYIRKNGVLYNASGMLILKD